MNGDKWPAKAGRDLQISQDGDSVFCSVRGWGSYAIRLDLGGADDLDLTPVGEKGKDVQLSVLFEDNHDMAGTAVTAP
jgi:hypothetical protein